MKTHERNRIEAGEVRKWLSPAEWKMIEEMRAREAAAFHDGCTASVPKTASTDNFQLMMAALAVAESRPAE